RGPAFRSFAGSAAATGVLCGKSRENPGLERVRQAVTRQITTELHGEIRTTLSTLLDPDQNLFAKADVVAQVPDSLRSDGLKRTNPNSPHSISVGAVGAGLWPAAGIT
ncbi:hypothetical protein, partial [Pseudomonas protegens]|uniref:hypothetical protein n=1 Tax=Pseudomonas protegens TaxID=380021 RepID=UPI001C49E32E